MDSRNEPTDLKRLLKELIAWAQTQEEIIALYLYGSHAQGRASALSDVDGALLARRDLSQRQLWRLEDHCAVRWPEVKETRTRQGEPG